MKDQTTQLLDHARDLLAQGELEQMLDHLQQVLFVDPSNDTAYALLNDLKKASKWRSLLDLAFKFRDAGEGGKAKELAEKVYEKDPTNQQALLLLEELQQRPFAEVAFEGPEVAPTSGPQEQFLETEAGLAEGDPDLVTQADRLISLHTVGKEIRELLVNGYFKRARTRLASSRSILPAEPLLALRREINQSEKRTKQDQQLLRSAKNALNKGDTKGALKALDQLSVQTSRAREMRGKVESAQLRIKKKREDDIAAAIVEICQLLSKDSLEEAEQAYERIKLQYGEDSRFDKLTEPFKAARHRHTQAKERKEELRKLIETAKIHIAEGKRSLAKAILVEAEEEFGRDDSELLQLHDLLRPRFQSGDLYYEAAPAEKDGDNSMGRPYEVSLFFRNSSSSRIKLTRLMVSRSNEIDQKECRPDWDKCIKAGRTKHLRTHSLQSKEKRLLRWLRLDWLSRLDDPVVETQVRLENGETLWATARLLPSGDLEFKQG